MNRILSGGLFVIRSDKRKNQFVLCRDNSLLNFYDPSTEKVSRLTTDTSLRKILKIAKKYMEREE